MSNKNVERRVEIVRSGETQRHVCYLEVLSRIQYPVLSSYPDNTPNLLNEKYFLNRDTEYVSRVILRRRTIVYVR